MLQTLFNDPYLFVAVENPETVDLEPFDVHCIAGLLKRYLRELPNPVIPVEYYDQFIKAVSKSFHEIKTKLKVNQISHN